MVPPCSGARQVKERWERLRCMDTTGTDIESVAGYQKSEADFRAASYRSSTRAGRTQLRMAIAARVLRQREDSFPRRKKNIR